MRKNVEDLYKSNYNVEFLSILRQPWTKTNSFSCLTSPKGQELFLYLDGCDAEYETHDGKKILAKSDDLIYTALGSRYKVKFIHFKTQTSGTLGINFRLYDENGDILSLDKDLIVFHTDEEIASCLERAESYADSTAKYVPARFKAILFQILAALGERQRVLVLNDGQGYPHVARAIRYIDSNIDSNVSIAELAALCHISEVYLRILFKKYTGMSPSRYRTELRLKKAKKYLRYGDIPVHEIGELLGFPSPAYFIKRFKEKYGCTPLEYRKKNQF